MNLNIKFPKKITRKTHKEWTQHCEIEFILFDLPVECIIKKTNFNFALRGYIEGLKHRKKDYGEGQLMDKRELFEVANQAIKFEPRIWNIGEKKGGILTNTWGIHYPKKQIVEYTSY